MTKSEHDGKVLRVARVYDILNCGKNNRFVANGKLVHNSGGDTINPQNLPRGGALRESIRAPEGYAIVACDSSQVEARTLAWFAGQTDLVEDFKHGVDVYSAFASKVYGKPINKHDFPQERFVGKVGILGLGYGVGAEKLRLTLKNGGVDLPIEECKRIVSIYRNTYSRIPALWKECDKALAHLLAGYSHDIGVGMVLHAKAVVKDGAIHGEIELPSQLKLRYPYLKAEVNDRGWLEYTYRRKNLDSGIYGGALTENIIQALARIVVSYQMLDIGEALKQKSKHKRDNKLRRVVHMVHDEVIAIVPEDEAKETEAMMEKIMSTPPEWALSLPVSCEAGSGVTYADAK